MNKEPKTIRQAVFNDDFIVGVVEGLDTLPGSIRKAREVVVDCEVKLKYSTAVADARQAVTDYIVETAYEVKNDKWIATDADLPDPKNIDKAKFGNEEKRKTETRRRLVKNEHYVNYCNAVADALHAEAVMRMDLGKAHASFIALEAEAHNLRSVAAMIAGLAHESTTQERIHRHVTSFETTVKLGENHG